MKKVSMLLEVDTETEDITSTFNGNDIELAALLCSHVTGDKRFREILGMATGALVMEKLSHLKKDMDLQKGKEQKQ